MDSGHLRTLRMGVDIFKSGRDRRRRGGSQHGNGRELGGEGGEKRALGEGRRGGVGGFGAPAPEAERAGYQGWSSHGGAGAGR